jgi:hypothetical protein
MIMDEKETKCMLRTLEKSDLKHKTVGIGDIAKSGCAYLECTKPWV